MRIAAAALAATFGAAAMAHVPGTSPEAATFEPPPPGSYTLAAIQAAPAGRVIDGSGRARDLADFTHGRITLVGLVYTRCDDAEGCPRATWAFNAVRAALRERPALEARVRLVTLSFDPVHDDYKSLGAWAARMGARRPGAEWHFLTTRSKRELAPILEGFGQDLRVQAGSRARPGTEAFSHTLKVFLLDPAGTVREIYSTAYLMPAMIVNDIETIAREKQAAG
jgi:cytochrome oxidase Cu insertion factor (SCO1/SenC/PrrC family)